jgi:hypothetical protein
MHEDVGEQEPLPIAKLNEEAPVIYKQLDGIRKLERHYEMLDIEFTIQQENYGCFNVVLVRTDLLLLKWL